MTTRTESGSAILSAMRYAPLVAALLAVGCGSNSPTAPSTATPNHGTPARVEVAAQPGMGTHGGTATITARVQDAYAATLPDITVTFEAESGTLSAATATTDANGVATTQLAAAPGGVKVHAHAGPAQSDLLVSVQPTTTAPSTTPQPAPTPVPTPDPQLPFAIRLVVVPGTAGAVTHFGLSGTGGVVRAVWTAGDGSSGTTTTPSVDYTYAQPGTFRASVTATDALGRTSADATTVVIAPAPIPQPGYTVALTATPPTLLTGNTSTLSATVAAVNGAPPVTNWAWDCDGDGTTDATTAATATCSYPAAGTYTARLTVTSGGGVVRGTATTTVTVSPQPVPEVSVSCGAATLPAATTCSVSAKLLGATVASSRITSVTWDFGDTATATLSTNTAQHAYGGASSYVVVVTSVVVTGTTATGSGSGTAVVTQ
jgi:PKD repeat protein